MKKNIAAPQPLKRSGVIATVRHKYARASGGNVDVEEDLTAAPESSATASAMTENDHRWAFDEEDDDRMVEIEGSCEIQRIFFSSGLHTPVPRGAAGLHHHHRDTTQDDDEEDDGNPYHAALYDYDDLSEEGGASAWSRALLSGGGGRTAGGESPAFHFLLSAPASRHGAAAAAESRGGHNEVGSSYDAGGLAGDFPLLGHSPNPHQQQHQQQQGADADEEYGDDVADEEVYAFFGGRRHRPYCFPRAANPMPLNTPFHASVTNDHPAMAMAAYYTSNASLYENGNPVVTGSRGHFYTLPSSGPGLHRVQLLKGTTDMDGTSQWDNDGDDSTQDGETIRATRNRSYSEPIPFVPAASTRG